MKKTQKKPKLLVWLVLILSIVLLCAGLYLIYLQQTPNKPTLNNTEQEQFLTDLPIIKNAQNKVIIPKIAVASPIKSGDSSVLDSAVWHRFPERGNPQSGGNTILAAHRYVFNWLPERISRSSIFYNLDKIQKGDKIYVDWHDKRYEYVVESTRYIKPNQSEIEQPSKEPILTLYTCTLEGDADGRIVIVAKPVK